MTSVAVGTPKRNDSSQQPSPALSLQDACRLIICKHLERYPPDSMGILSQEEWESVVRLRHEKTTPMTFKKYSVDGGGLDGTGRKIPALSAKLILEIEQANAHLRDSKLVDKLVWKDCVEHRFKRDGGLRPTALLVPWPVLVQSIQNSKSQLSLCVKAMTTSREVLENKMDIVLFQQTIDVLVRTPMNVALLQTTGIGKVVKKFIKTCNNTNNEMDEWWSKQSHPSPKAALERVLAKWKSLPGISENKTKKPAGFLANGVADEAQGGEELNEQTKQEQDDLRMAQSCNSWRELYQALADREVNVRELKGKRMREIRMNLSKDRPKIVKVRPASGSKRFDAMMEKKKLLAATGSTRVASSKMQQLRAETAVAASWQKSKAKSTSSNTTNRGKSFGAAASSSFGAAVAFASGSGSGKKRARDSKVISLSGGKQMKIPQKANAGRGRMGEAFASRAKKKIKSFRK